MRLDYFRSLVADVSVPNPTGGGGLHEDLIPPLPRARSTESPRSEAPIAPALFLVESSPPIAHNRVTVSVSCSWDEFRSRHSGMTVRPSRLALELSASSRTLDSLWGTVAGIVSRQVRRWTHPEGVSSAIEEPSQHVPNMVLSAE